MSPYSGLHFNEAAVRQLFHKVLADGCIVVNEGGFIAGVLTPLMFAPDVFVATELVWWAPDSNGTELREWFEGWAAEVGASAVHMSALNNQHASRLTAHLDQNGYTPIEVAYLKAI